MRLRFFRAKGLSSKKRGATGGREGETRPDRQAEGARPALRQAERLIPPHLERGVVHNQPPKGKKPAPVRPKT